ncbi:MAG TPA: hypothetical protein VGV64_05400 [Thermoplasmata archaeon]|nr:hypothetical protein [Thermoplasmata archaeon]
MAPRGDRAQLRERDAGVVLAFTPSGRVTVRSIGPDAAPEGTWVHDPLGRFRGRVVRVFGPVAQPYLAVEPTKVPTPVEASALLGVHLLSGGPPR